MSEHFAAALGRQLRQVCQAIGWSLDAAAAKSQGKWKAGTIGTYERGERALTASGLADLAALYGVRIAELLPGQAVRRRELSGAYLDINLSLLANITHGRLAPLARYAAALRARQSTPSGGELRVDAGGLRLMADLCDMSLEDLVIEFVKVGIIPVDPATDFGVQIPRQVAAYRDVLS